MKSLTALIQGDSGAGKSWLGDSAPGPRLYVDVEGRADHTPSNKVEWDPHDSPPELGPDQTAVVRVRAYSDFGLVVQWLQSGKHPFVSVIVDSVTELQQRLIDEVAGVQILQTQDWGEVLRKLQADVRRLKDLRNNPVNPIVCVCVIAGSDEKNGKQRPMLQGQLASKIAYHFDLVGYLQWGVSDDGSYHRYLFIHPAAAPQLQVKDNTHTLSQHYGGIVTDPDLTEMVKVLNTQETQP